MTVYHNVTFKFRKKKHFFLEHIMIICLHCYMVSSISISYKWFAQDYIVICLVGRVFA